MPASLFWGLSLSGILTWDSIFPSNTSRPPRRNFKPSIWETAFLLSLLTWGSISRSPPCRFLERRSSPWLAAASSVLRSARWSSPLPVPSAPPWLAWFPAFCCGNGCRINSATNSLPSTKVLKRKGPFTFFPCASCRFFHFSSSTCLWGSPGCGCSPFSGCRRSACWPAPWFM